MSTSKDEIISPAVSTRICNHMNEDHFVSVYAMTMKVINIKPGWKLTDCAMEKVSADGCALRATLCSGNLCELERAFYPFSPKLQSTAESRPRLVAIHHSALRPQWRWLLGALPIFILITSGFIFCCMYIGLETVEEMITEDESAHAFTTFLFGSPKIFTYVVRASFWFLVVAHVLEAIYAGYHSKVTLKLQWLATIEWSTLTLLVGFPVLSHLVELMSAHSSAERRKSNKSS